MFMYVMYKKMNTASIQTFEEKYKLILQNRKFHQLKTWNVERISVCRSENVLKHITLINICFLNTTFKLKVKWSGNRLTEYFIYYSKCNQHCYLILDAIIHSFIVY